MFQHCKKCYLKYVVHEILSVIRKQWICMAVKIGLENITVL